MTARARIARTLLIATAGLAATAGTASASPGNGDGQRADNAPGGAYSHVDEHRPAGAGHGRKVG